MEELENYQDILRRLEQNVTERVDLESDLMDAEQELVEKLVEHKVYFPHCDLDIQHNVFVRSARCLMQSEDNYYIYDIEDAKIVNGHFVPLEDDGFLEFVQGDEYLMTDTETGDELGHVHMLGVFDFKVVEGNNLELYYPLEDLVDGIDD